MNELYFLDANGYPINPRKTFINIKRINLPSVTSLLEANHEGKRISIPYRMTGRWDVLIGWMTKISFFSSGIVVHFPQDVSQSSLKWPTAVLWIPNEGSCGILN